MKKEINTNLLITYRACLKNAGDLLSEAKFLMKKGSFPRAYALAFTAIEEIAKSQLVADLFTGYISKQEFDASFRDHRRKIKRTQWAVLYRHGVFADLPENAIIPKSSKRMSALYIDVDDQMTPISPQDSITEEEARELIKIGEAGIEKIIAWQEMGVQIGTKGFMK